MYKLIVLNSVRLSVAGITLGVALPYAVLAQEAATWPAKPVQMVVPYVAGGPIDFLGRALARQLGAALGQAFVLDNRAGAGGAIGSQYVAKARPDGHTVLLTSSSLATLPSIMKSPGYDPLKDFAPVTMVAQSVGFILIANKDSPVKSVQDLIAAEKATPGKINYASAGNGNVMHFAAESFNSAAGTKMTHVPYKGAGQAINDLIGGRVDVAFIAPTSAVAFIKAGTVNALGIAAANRWDVLPTLPTVHETGVKNFAYAPYYGLWFPAGTPAPIVQRMRDEVAKVLDDPAIKRSFLEQGFVPVGSSPGEFAGVNAKEMAFTRDLVQKIGLLPE